MKTQTRRIGKAIARRFAAALSQLNQWVQQRLAPDLLASQELCTAAVEHLQASEAWNRAILLAVPDLMAVIDADGFYLDFSPNRFIGGILPIAREALGQLRATDVLPPEIAAQQLTALKTALRTGEMQIYEQQLQFGDRLQYEEVRMVPYQENTVLCVVRNITDRKQAEQALRESQQFIEQIADNSPNVIYIYDLVQQRNLYVNQTVLAFLGYDREEVMTQVDQSLASLMHPDDLDRAREHFERLAGLPEGATAEFEYRMRHKTGDWCWFLSRDAVFKRDANGCVAQIIGSAQEITTRKSIEAALRESEARFRRLAENLPGVVYRYAQYPDGTFSLPYISRRCVELYGVEAEAIMQDVNRLWATIHPEDIPLLQSAVARSIEQSGHLFTVEHRIITPDGQLKWVQAATSLPEFQENGEIIWDGVAIDITARKQAEQQLRDSQAFLDGIINAITDPIFVKDEQHRWVLGNQAFCQWVGASNAEFSGKTDYDFFPAEQAKVLWDNDEQVLTTGVEKISEEVATHATQGLRTVASKKTRFQDSAGKHFLVGYSRDVTVQKQVEAEIRQRQQQLDAIASNLPGGVFRIIRYADGHYSGVFASEGYRTLCGIEPSMFQANAEAFIQMLHPEDREEHFKKWENFIQDGSHRFEAEARYILPTGEMKWIATTAQLLQQPNGNVIIDGIDFDVSDRKQIELEITRSRDLREAIYEESADALFLVDPVTLLTLDCNQRAVDLFAADRKQALINIEGRTLRRFPETDEEMAQIAQQISTQGFWTQEVEYVTLKGNLFWGSIAVKQITVADSSLYLIRVTDISDRKLVEAERQRAEDSLRQSEGKLRALIQALPDLIARVSRDGIYLDFFNTPHFRSIADLENLVGTPVEATLPPALAQQRRNAIQAALQTGELQIYEQEVCIDGVPQVEECRIAVCDTNEVLITVRDITERRRAQTQLEDQNALLARILKGEPLPDLLDASIHSIEQRLEGALCSILLLDAENRLRYGAAPSLPPDYIQAFDGVRIGARVCSCGTAAFRQETVVVTDIATDPLWQDFKDIPLSYGLQACWSHPILASDGRVLGTFATHYHEIRSPQPCELDVVRQAANIAGIAIERAQSEIALRESEARFRQIAETVREGFFVFETASHCYSYINPALATIFGIPDQTIYDEGVPSWLNNVHPDDRDRVEAQLQQELQGRISDDEYRFIRPDGSICWVRAQAFPVCDDRGTIVRVVGTVQDTSDRKQAEIALRKAEERYSRATRAAKVGVWEWNLNTNEFYLDPNIKALLGYTDAEIPNDIEYWITFVHPDDREAVMAAAQDHLTGKTPEYVFEHRMLHKNGSIVWILVRGQLFRDAQGNPERMLGTDTDITDRKRAEDALRESEQRLAMALDGARAGIWQWDMQTNATYWSDENFHLLGYEPGSCETNYDNWLNAIHPEDRERAASLVSQVVAEQSKLNLEYRVLLPDGTVRWLSDIGTLLYDADNNPVGMTGIQVDITDRKQAELEIQQLNAELEQRVEQRTQELRRSEQDLRTIFNNVYDAIFIHELDGTILDINDRALELHGATREQLLTATIADLAAPDASIDQIPDIFQQVQTGEVLQFEWRDRRLGNGKCFDVEVSLKQVVLGNRPVVIAGVRDITDRKQAEQALLESRQRYATLATAAPVGIYRTDRKGRCLYVNDRWCQIAGLTAAEAAESGWVSSLHPDDRDRVAQAWNHFVQTGETFRLEYRFQCPEGIVTWVFGQAVPELDEDGSVKGYVGTITDISDRKRVENERKQAEIALRESEERFRQMAEAVDAVFWLTDLTPRTLYVSPAFEQVWGCPAEQIMGSFEDFLSTLYPDDREQASRNMALRFTQEVDFEYRIVHASGEIRWIRDRAFPIHNESGEIYRIAGVAEDITDRKWAEAAVQQSEQDLRTIFNNVYDAIFIHELDGTILDVNDRALELNRVTREQILAASIADLSPPTAPLEQLPAIFERVEAGEAVRFEWICQRLGDRSVFESEVALRLVNLANRSVCIAAVRDISERKAAERALRRSEAMLAEAQEVAKLGSWEFDLHTGKITWTKTLFQIFDLDPTQPEPTLAELERLYYPDDFARLQQLMAQTIATGEPYQLTLRIPLSDGSLRYLEGTGRVEYNAQGEAVRLYGTAQNITTRKEAELALQESEQRFRQLAENVGEVFWLTDLQSRLLYISPAFEQVWGRSASSLFDAGTNILDTLHPDDRAWVKAQMELKLQGNYDVEYRILRPDGEIRWIRDRSFLIRNEAGEVYRIGGIAADITERRQTEQLIRDREVRFRSVVECNMLGIGFWEETRVTYANGALLNMIGYTQEEMLQGQIDWQSLTPPEYWSQDAEAFAQTQATGSCTPYEKEYICKSGRRIPVLIGGGHFEGDKQRGAFFVLDIRDRKRAEAALREAQQFAQSIADKTPAALYIYDLANQCNIYSNRSIVDLLGYSAAEVQAMGTAVMPTLLHPEDIAAVARHQQALSLAADGEDLQLEYRMRHTNGQWCWFYSRDSVFKRDDTGRAIQYIGAAQDITKRKQLEQELRQINLELERRVEERTLDLQNAMEAAEAASRAKSAFLANMSHELRTPLNAILGFAQLMSRDQSLGAEKRQQLGIINRSGKHLLNLINDILEMSKIEAGGIRFSPICFDLYTLLNTLEEMFYLRAQEKGLRLVFDRADIVPQYIETDENKLRQVLINLLGNAIKFTQTGSVTLAVAVAQQPETEAVAVLLPQFPTPPLRLTFAVQDTGIGIDPRELDSLFEPFIQSQNRQTQEGTGLGLPISRQFVQFMGGDLAVRSRPGVGSTFAFTIPVLLTDTANLPVPLSSRHVLSLADHQPPCRILVVEDNDNNRQLLVQLLQSVGFEVQAAINGQTAIDCWQTWQPHLVWMDMRMPEMDGYEATRQIRALEREMGRWGDGEMGRWGDGEMGRWGDGEMGSGASGAGGAGGAGGTADPMPSSLIPSSPHPLTPSSPHPLTPSSPHPFIPSPTIIIALTASAFEEERAKVLNVGCDDFVRKPFQETELLEKISDYLGVQYRYAEAEPVDRTFPPAKSLDAIAALRSLPAHQLTQLQQATIQLDSDQLAALIEQIAPEQPRLAALLMEKLENFDLQQILELLQAAMQRSEPSDKPSS